MDVQELAERTVTHNKKELTDAQHEVNIAILSLDVP